MNQARSDRPFRGGLNHAVMGLMVLLPVGACTSARRGKTLGPPAFALQLHR